MVSINDGMPQMMNAKCFSKIISEVGEISSYVHELANEIQYLIYRGHIQAKMNTGIICTLKRTWVASE